MTKQASEIKTPADLLVFIHEFGQSQITALNGLMDKVPQGLKDEYVAMRDKMNTLLKGLPPLDQVPAASDAAYALNSFARTIQSIFEYAAEFRTRIETMATSLQAAQTSLNGLNEQVTKGDLVSKDKVALAVDSAKAEAVKPYITAVAGLRKDMIALAGLPEAPETVLNAVADVFTAALDQAKKNLAFCTGKGLALNGTGAACLKKSLWLDATAFQGEAAIIGELAPGLKLHLPAAADPMKGAPGATALQQQQTPETAPARKLTLA